MRVRRRVSGWGGWANEAARLVWLLGPAGFPEGSGEKSISSSSRTLAKIERPVKSNSTAFILYKHFSQPLAIMASGVQPSPL